MPKTVFLDRDGIINRCPPPHQYVSKWEDFVFLPGVEGALMQLKKAGYQLVLVSNQRGIARGMITKEQVDGLHVRMQAYLKRLNAQLDGIYVCPHNNGECSCRKPEIGLFRQAEVDLEIDKAYSWMVGDNVSDVEAGKRYGVRTILTTSLKEAVKEILEEERHTAEGGRNQ